MVERDGFLTKADREFLRGEKEYSGKNARHMRYQRRRDIRERAHAALEDFALLYGGAQQADIEHIFSDVVDRREADPADTIQLERGIAATLAVLYWGLENQRIARRFDDFLKEAIHTHESVHNGRLVETALETSAAPAERWLDKIVGKAERGEFNRMSKEEMMLFHGWYEMIEGFDKDVIRELKQSEAEYTPVDELFRSDWADGESYPEEPPSEGLLDPSSPDNYHSPEDVEESGSE